MAPLMLSLEKIEEYLLVNLLVYAWDLEYYSEKDEFGHN